MADIKTTVNAMPMKDLNPEPPDPTIEQDPVLTAVQIQTIVKELAQPWKYGNSIDACARRNKTTKKMVQKVQDAVSSRLSTLIIKEEREV